MEINEPRRDNKNSYILFFYVSVYFFFFLEEKKTHTHTQQLSKAGSANGSLIFVKRIYYLKAVKFVRCVIKICFQTIK